jgi:hypothetical protein
MPYSTRELINEAIGRLTLTEVGQSVSAADYETIKRKLWSLLAELKAARIVDLFVNPIDEDSTDIPDELFNGLAIALANEAAPDFGITPVVDPDRNGLWQRIKKAASRGPSFFTQEAKYF